MADPNPIVPAATAPKAIINLPVDCAEQREALNALLAHPVYKYMIVFGNTAQADWVSGKGNQLSGATDPKWVIRSSAPDCIIGNLSALPVRPGIATPINWNEVLFVVVKVTSVATGVICRQISHVRYNNPPVVALAEISAAWMS